VAAGTALQRFHVAGTGIVERPLKGRLEGHPPQNWQTQLQPHSALPCNTLPGHITRVSLVMGQLAEPQSVCQSGSHTLGIHCHDLLDESALTLPEYTVWLNHLDKLCHRL